MIMQTGTGFWASKTLLTALDFELFRIDEKINLPTMIKPFFDRRVEKRSLSWAKTTLFKEVYRKKAKSDGQFIFLSILTHLSQNISMSIKAIKSTLKLNCTVFDFKDVFISYGFLIRRSILEHAEYSNRLNTDTPFWTKRNLPIGGIEIDERSNILILWKFR